MINGLLLESF